MFLLIFYISVALQLQSSRVKGSGNNNYTSLNESSCLVGGYDCRGILTPLDTDTSRISDGVSSASATTVTGPAFAPYTGPSPSLQDAASLAQAEYMLNLSLNGLSQGVADAGGGDARIEEARLALLSSPPSPPPSAYFTVDAAIEWNPSTFYIQNGETYVLNVDNASSQSWMDGDITSGADGYFSYYDAIQDCYIAQGACRSYLSRPRRYSSANWFSLLCSIGFLYDLVGEVQPGLELDATYLATDEATILDRTFYAGTSLTFTANHTGELLCFANDAMNSYWNNRGQLNVSITRLSWPVSNSSYYQEFSIPSCDSAIARYNPNMTCNAVLSNDNLWQG